VNEIHHPAPNLGKQLFFNPGPSDQPHNGGLAAESDLTMNTMNTTANYIGAKSDDVKTFFRFPKDGQVGSVHGRVLARDGSATSVFEVSACEEGFVAGRVVFPERARFEFEGSLQELAELAHQGFGTVARDRRFTGVRD